MFSVSHLSTTAVRILAEINNASIHHLKVDEVQRCKDIRLACLADAPYAFGSTFEGESAESDQWWRQRLTDGYWVVAHRDGADIGVAMQTRQGLPASFSPTTSAEVALPAQDDYLWIRAVWVRPEHRGQGFVDLLCTHLIDRAAALGEQVVVLGVRQGNDRARQAYLRMGFAEVGTFHPVSGAEDLTNSLMVKPLG